MIIDLVLGIVLPLICLVADPFVFKGELMGNAGLFGSAAIFAYTAVALSMAGLIVWMIFHPKSGFLAGVLLAGKIFSLMVGLVLFPFSLIGLLAVIGVLGFTPLGTAFVYHRNFRSARRSMDQKKPASNLTIFSGCVSVILLSIGAQAGVNETVERSLSAIIDGREANSIGIAMLHWVPAHGKSDEWIRIYESEQDPVKKNRIAEAYRIVMGHNIEAAIIRRND